MSTAIAYLQRMNRGTHFRAHSLRPGEAVAPIDPILGVDHAWISAATFPPHPHAGFSAVSYLFSDSETGMSNRDSIGNHNVIAPGGLHWTAAGRGVVHEEVPVHAGRTVHMLQIFINLARDKQGLKPFALSLAPEHVPVVEMPGICVRVPLGRFANVRSPLTTPTDVTLLDAFIGEDAELTIPIAEGHNAFVLPIDGTVVVDNEEFDIDTAKVPVFAAEQRARAIRLRSRRGVAKVAVFHGSPLRQPVHWQGSLALASEKALEDAATAYKRGEFGVLTPATVSDRECSFLSGRG